MDSKPREQTTGAPSRALYIKCFVFSGILLVATSSLAVCMAFFWFSTIWEWGIVFLALAVIAGLFSIILFRMGILQLKRYRRAVKKQQSARPTDSSPKGKMTLDDLVKAKALLDSGAITEEEFQKIKSQVDLDHLG